MHGAGYSMAAGVGGGHLKWWGANKVLSPGVSHIIMGVGGVQLSRRGSPITAEGVSMRTLTINIPALTWSIIVSIFDTN